MARVCLLGHTLVFVPNKSLQMVKKCAKTIAFSAFIWYTVSANAQKSKKVKF